ncbi:hypothetical protein QUF50_09660, partial [Thiotrichales bacterium HSG1]|nr:hypothetical protein [Thiotrichales bacterium HSG1]
HPEYITDEKGQKKSVVISISGFQELMEDIADLVTISERKNEPTISHQELIKSLEKDGFI